MKARMARKTKSAPLVTEKPFTIQWMRWCWVDTIVLVKARLLIWSPELISPAVPYTMNTTFLSEVY